MNPSSENGFPDSIQTYGLVSGLWTSTFALGAFIGPFISGILYDYVGFRKGVIFIIATQLLVGCITALFLGYHKKKAKVNAKLYKELDAQEPLIANHKHNFDSYGGTTDSVINGSVANGGGVDGGAYKVNGNGHSNSNSPVSIAAGQLKDRKCYFNDSSHQTKAAILV